MTELERLYLKLEQTAPTDFYTIESEFFCKFYYAAPYEQRLSCVNTFLTVSSWSGTSLRDGVWTFYESTDSREILDAIEYLRTQGDTTATAELAEMMEHGIHDYHSPIYKGNYNYPEEWITDSEPIDDWITVHEDWLMQWQYDLLMNNRTQILASIS